MRVFKEMKLKTNEEIIEGIEKILIKIAKRIIKDEEIKNRVINSMNKKYEFKKFEISEDEIIDKYGLNIVDTKLIKVNERLWNNMEIDSISRLLHSEKYNETIGKIVKKMLFISGYTQCCFIHLNNDRILAICSCSKSKKTVTYYDHIYKDINRFSNYECINYYHLHIQGRKNEEFDNTSINIEFIID